MNTEEEIKNIQIKQAILEHQIEEHFSIEDDFQQRVLEKLEYLTERDIKAFQFIDTEIDRRKAKTAYFRALYTELSTKGIWAVIALAGLTAWYAFNSYIHKG